MGKPMTLEQQAALVKRWYPNAKPRIKTRNGERALFFHLDLCPTPASSTYRVLFAYALGVRPHVYVMDPKPIDEVCGVRTPHLNYDDTLCLYDPGAEQWASDDALIYTVVQWTIRWLFHYEHWVVFGEWNGDEESVLVPKSDQESSPVLERPNE